MVSTTSSLCVREGTRGVGVEVCQSVSLLFAVAGTVGVYFLGLNLYAAHKADVGTKNIFAQVCMLYDCHWALNILNTTPRSHSGVVLLYASISLCIVAAPCLQPKELITVEEYRKQRHIMDTRTPLYIKDAPETK